MSIWQIPLYQRAARWLKGTLRLLAPQYPDCLMCGSPTRPGLHAPGAATATDAQGPRSGASNGDGAQSILQLHLRINAQLCPDCQRKPAWIQPQEIRCYACGRPERCPDCSRREDGHLLWNRSAVRYTPEMREWLADYKYRGLESAGPLLHSMLYPLYDHLLTERRRATGDAAWSWDAIAFVPLSAERLEERGFNQAERFAAGLAEHGRLPYAPLLIRTRDSGRQSHKNREARIAEMAGLFAPEPGCSGYLEHLYAAAGVHRPVRILLVDDIYTTGSTTHACAAALHGAVSVPLEICALTWARAISRASHNLDNGEVG